MIVSPPSWRIATSKDTRVRVDAFSKIMARTLPSYGLGTASPAFNFAFRTFASSRMPRRSAADNVERSRKWRGVVMICLFAFIMLPALKRPRRPGQHSGYALMLPEYPHPSRLTEAEDARSE